MIVVGIDPSISGTAVCSGRHDSTKFRCIHYPSSRLGPHMRDRFRRYEVVIARVMADLEPLKPDVIVIEDYSHGSTNRTSEIGEFGGLLRWHLTDICKIVEESAPTTMLKFVTGNGKAIKGQSKKRVAAALWTDFRVSFEQYDEGSDDMADAFAYWQIAKAAAAEPNTLKPHQLEALDTVFGARLKTVRALAQGVDCDASDRDEAEASRTAAI